MVGQPNSSAQTGGSEPAGDGDAEEAARYIVEVISDLGQVARRHRLDTLGFLLDMAQMEAEDIIRLGKGRTSI